MWNEELLRLSRMRGRRADEGKGDDDDCHNGNGTNDDNNDTDEINAREEESEYESDDCESVLLDARNVYESNVGHFAVPRYTPS